MCPWEGSQDLYPDEVGKWLLGGLISAYFPERAEAALTRERLREQLAGWQQLSTLTSRHPAFREEAAPLVARLEREIAEATGQCLRLTTTFRLVD